MQEDIERRTVALSIKAAKLTGRVLAFALEELVKMIQEERHEGMTPQGKQTIEQLKSHGGPTSSVPLDGDTKLFDRVAKKHDVDYAFEQVGPEKYLLTFRAAQVDAMTDCFAEYSQRFMEKNEKQHPTIAKQMEQFKDMAARTAQTAPREQERIRERVREAALDER